MSDLRSSLIKLAHEKPELREDILPLLKTSARKFKEGDNIPLGIIYKVHADEHYLKSLPSGRQLLVLPSEAGYKFPKHVSRDKYMMYLLDEGYNVLKVIGTHPSFEGAKNYLDSKWRSLKASKQASSPIRKGDTWNGASVQIHRFESSLKITDMTYAGKRGKRVNQASVKPSWQYLQKHGSDSEQKWFDNITKAILTYGYSSYKQVMSYLNELDEQFEGDIEIKTRQLRGVDVAPSSRGKIEMKTYLFSIRAELHDFSIRDLSDMANEPVTMQKNKSSAMKFYKFISNPKNQDALKGKSYSDILSILNRLGIGTHSWYAMD